MSRISRVARTASIGYGSRRGAAYPVTTPQITPERKELVERLVERVVKEQGETLKKLADE